MSEFISQLRLDEEVKDYALETVERIKKRGKQFIQFGAGITGENVVRYFHNLGLKPLCFCDNNPLKQNTYVLGIPVLSLEDIKERYKDYLIVISCDAFLEISRQLVDNGIVPENILYMEPDWLKSPKGQGEFIRQHISEFEEAYYFLDDEKSRQVYLGVLNYKITHNLKYLEGLTDSIPYFDKELIHMDENEVFLDCGAFIGDTLLDFVKETNGKYRKALCFEPNAENVTMLKQTITDYNLSNVIVQPYGLSDKKQTLRFSGSSENGKVTENGAVSIECDTIDSLCFNEVEKITFIKMDIEGSEYYALKGAKKVIQRDHPKLAICVYHEKDDFFVLTKLIKEMYSGYRLYFRQYELSGEETVCIAIPEEE